MAATPNKQFKNICVLSGFNYDKHKEFVEAAIDLEAAFVKGSQVSGIIPRALKSLGNLSDSLTGEELVISVEKVHREKNKSIALQASRLESDEKSESENDSDEEASDEEESYEVLNLTLMAIGEELDEVRVLHNILQHVITPRKGHVDEVTRLDVRLLDCIIRHR
ncbi:hypothetical protein WN944_006605 [Citrus x changshan-huyou]|uniref:Uncharacterized protein n=1 Tax=Citrus x changshan-huyou TaxID=2935761 RepID=A0AAP0MM51_9ROSI